VAVLVNGREGGFIISESEKSVQSTPSGATYEVKSSKKTESNMIGIKM
jgi:hypothetical protein